MNQKPRIYVSAQASEQKLEEHECNFLLIRPDERIALNPIYIQRAQFILNGEYMGYEVMSRSPHISIILEAAKIPYTRDY